MSVEITEKRIARQPPEAREMIYALLGRLAELEKRFGRVRSR